MDVSNSSKIPGLQTIKLTIHGDDRGSFTEMFQKQKLVDAGLDPSFNPVQTNISVNVEKGIVRGIHAEPWNKYITPLSGKVFVAIVDLRADNFGVVETFQLEFGDALYVPKGCGNSYQTLTENVNYLYHVDDHWSPDVTYQSIHPADATLAIDWPISIEQSILSEKDQRNPAFSDAKAL